MSTTPTSIGKAQTLADAQKVMLSNDIRHLPVLDGGKLLGMLTDRDVHLISSLKGVDPTKVLVEDAMSQNAFSVAPETPLDEVASTMAERKYGSAVVVDGNRLVGILTTVDVCRALAELLTTRLG